MAHEEEGWIEINIPTAISPDRELLRKSIDPLLHVEFAGELESWHYFWEPALRLRLRWRDLERQAELEDRLSETLDRWRDEGRLDSWFAGNHGEAGKRHYGEADAYGPEVWDLIQKEWEISSELAMRFLLLGEAGLTGSEHRTFEQQWGRHVHLHTNRIYGFPADAPWAAEIVRCLGQARGYLRHAIKSLQPWRADYQPLIDRYMAMEKAATNALKAWNGDPEGGSWSPPE
jgi:hypothetical protein